MTAWLALAWLLTGCVLNVWQLRLYLAACGHIRKKDGAWAYLGGALCCAGLILAGPAVLAVIASANAVERHDRIIGDA